jgi:hypothetical protein
MATRKTVRRAHTTKQRCREGPTEDQSHFQTTARRRRWKALHTIVIFWCDTSSTHTRDGCHSFAAVAGDTKGQKPIVSLQQICRGTQIYRSCPRTGYASRPCGDATKAVGPGNLPYHSGLAGAVLAGRALDPSAGGLMEGRLEGQSLVCRVSRTHKLSARRAFERTWHLEKNE